VCWLPNIKLLPNLYQCIPFRIKSQEKYFGWGADYRAAKYAMVSLRALTFPPRDTLLGTTLGTPGGTHTKLAQVMEHLLNLDCVLRVLRGQETAVDYESKPFFLD
jgi:hypothetical protein